MDGKFGLRAEDAAPWSFAHRDSGRPIRVRTRREVRPADPALPVALQPRRGADPSLNNKTCSLRAKPACCDYASLALRIEQHRSAGSKRKPRYRLCTIFGGLDQLEICPRAYVRELNPCDKRRGFLVLPSASCSATPQRSRPKPQQTCSLRATPACSPIASLGLCI